MGAKQSTDGKLTLAEKRYRINSPKKIRQRSQQHKQSLRLKTTTSMSIDHATSMDENLRIAHSNSAGKIPDGPVPQASIDSITPIQTPTVMLTMTPFFSDQQEIVSKHQRGLIEQSWKRSRKSGADHVGSKVFLLVLIAEPDIKSIFGLDKTPQGRLKYDPRFRKHTALISKSFDFAVKNLNYAEKLAQHFHSLGKKHVAMQGRGFKSKYWTIFFDCLIQTASDWLNCGYKCQDTMDAWKILIAFIIRHMEIGFEKEKLMRKRYAPTTISTTANPLIGTKVKQRAPKNQLSLPCRQSNTDHLSLPAIGRSANERSASWVGADPTFNEDFSRLRMTASQRHPKNRARQATAPERERPDSPSSDYYTPPSSRRQISLEVNLEKKLLNAQHRTRNHYVNA